MTDNKYKIEYQRHGDTGVLTESFPDGTWRAVSRPVNDWIYIASRIQAANREEKVVEFRGAGERGEG